MISNEIDSGQNEAVQTTGQALADARRRLGLTVDEVALKLRLAPRQVQAMESDDFDALPGRTIARGFVRNYARLLDLDTNQVLALSPTLCPDQGASLVSSKLSQRIQIHDEVSFMGRRKVGWKRFLVVGSLGMLVAAAAAYVWLQVANDTPPPAPVAATATPVPQPVILTPIAPGSGNAAVSPVLPATPPAAVPSPVAPASPATLAPSNPPQVAEPMLPALPAVGETAAGETTEGASVAPNTGL